MEEFSGFGSCGVIWVLGVGLVREDLGLFDVVLEDITLSTLESCDDNEDLV